MNILAIETSCDETSLALIEAKGGLKAPKFNIKKHFIASQIEIHRAWGGVVPNLAKREHEKNLPLLFKKLEAKSYKLKANAIAVTVGPGLEPALWTGVNFAKEIKKKHFPKIYSERSRTTKIIGTNHLHGHMYSFLLPKSYKLKAISYPAVQLLVSGGHTILILMKSLTDYKKLGETRDDAAGEAFDKVARMLKLPYPGGPEIETLAKKGNPDAIDFPRPMIRDKNYDFSFSGLKTSVLYYLKANEAKSYKLKANVAASFQQAAIDVLITKTMRAAQEHNAKSIILSGGVAANSNLQKLMKLQAKSYKLNFLSANKKFQGDNAAMIAVAGYITHLRKKKYALKAKGSLSI
ncbi:tRNA (adenosine(37)-N6)-threonylcarbamoyltransferase complex transferase subunit TsaD [bacterium]|nr:tRNA (adenosine(37)-N6)-threonylcarbamoyltransferase complex transferase subunit TsaD [bacterium]|tara:strand:- start:4014 stop:5063 length:1050 start_codon:yes stop_codon:yes gene_type:complete